MKIKYTDMKTEELHKRLKENKLATMQSYGSMGTVDAKGVAKKGTAKEGMAKRIKKETAKILTELNRRKHENL